MGDVKVINCSGNTSMLITVTQSDKSLTITNYRYVT
jgi:hypothetical protein